MRSVFACEISDVASLKIISTVALTEPHRDLLRGAVPNAEIADRTCRTPDDVRALIANGCDAMLTFIMPNDLAAARAESEMGATAERGRRSRDESGADRPTSR